jgi:fatty acid desaturase
METTVDIPARVRTVEWLTVGLIVLVYATLGSLVWFHTVLPWWFILPVGATAAALQSSLQHEALHGHPTRSRKINEALVFLTPHFWLPYGSYRDTHLRHHNDAHLTHPHFDPESQYLLPEEWAALPGLKRELYLVNQTLGGRMLIGPAISIIRFWSAEFNALLSGHFDGLGNWRNFAFSSVIIVTYVGAVCNMPLWQYFLLIAYPGISLALVRSYCEHQAAQDVAHRTIIVEASPFWSLLFLNNNLHVAHHARPNLAWYELPAYYRAERENLIARNNGYLMKGYGEIFRRYFVRPKEPILYPDPRWLKS